MTPLLLQFRVDPASRRKAALSRRTRKRSACKPRVIEYYAVRLYFNPHSACRNTFPRSLIVAPSYSSVGPSGAVGVTRRGPIVSNLAEAGLAMGQGVCFSRGVNFQRRPSTTNLGGSRETTSDRISSRRLAWMTDNEPSVCILIAGSTIRTSPGHPAPLKTTKRIKQKGR